jgi:hypothetical protein
VVAAGDPNQVLLDGAAVDYSGLSLSDDRVGHDQLRLLFRRRLLSNGFSVLTAGD